MERQLPEHRMPTNLTWSDTGRESVFLVQSMTPTIRLLRHSPKPTSKVDDMNAIDAILHMLADAGVGYLFGNPGTTELPLSDALVDHPRIQYILGLQEVPVMAMADGYAQASRSVGAVNVHISCGLGNSMGMLYNAHRAGSPLIVTAGQQDRRLKLEEPVLWSDMLRVARPWTKWAVELERAQDVPVAIRRALRTALTPPTGPVFLSLPVDLLQEEVVEDLSSSPPLDVRTRPPEGALRRAAELLADAQNPCILVGSRLIEADGVGELVAVAELLGAPVIHESATSHGRLGFPTDHPLAAPGMPLWAPEIRERLDEFDVVLAVGMDVFQLYLYFEPARALPEHVRLIHLDQNAWEVGKNYPTEVGAVGDPKVGLQELATLIRALQTSEQKEASVVRARRREDEHRRLRLSLIDQAVEERPLRPMTPLTLMETLARILPSNVAVIEEAVTTTNTYFERFGALKDPTGYFAHRGWALGWGLGCSLGVKLAWPDRPVLALLGEGAAMYGIQGLWTAARYRIPVTFVICNNAQYGILKACGQRMELPNAMAGRFEGMDTVDPEIDMVQLARSLGVQAERISEPEALSAKVRESLTGDLPRLFDVPIQRSHQT